MACADCAKKDEAAKCFNDAINFAVEVGVLGGDFLELWRLGEWDAIAVEFPDFKGQIPRA